MEVSGAGDFYVYRQIVVVVAVVNLKPSLDEIGFGMKIGLRKHGPL